MDAGKKDTRMVCKYGSKCYQKNPAHHVKYKHPPKRPHNTNTSPPAKKFKPNDDVEQAPSISNDISDSDSVHSNGSATAVGGRLKACSEEKELATVNSSQKDNDVKFTPATIDDKSFIKEKFLVEMPDDFYQFWQLCERLKANNPSEAFKNVGVLLVGPYDVLAGKFCNVQEKSDEEYLIHWRYYYDPPEFQTVLKMDDSKCFHIGYFRDEPDANPVFLASNSAGTDGSIEVMGDNIFAAVSIHLESLKKTADPFKKVHIAKLQAAVQKEAENLGLSLSKKSDGIRKRDLKTVTRCFNRMGLVVPYNKRTQLGYRGLALNDKDLKTLLTKIKDALPEQMDKYLSDLQPVLTYASIALDECDFGTGIELGWNLLFYGIDSLNRTTANFLRNSYGLLQRDAFAKIATAHMSNRRKGNQLSILSS